MNEEQWDRTRSAHTMLDALRGRGRLRPLRGAVSDRKLRLLAVACWLQADAARAGESTRQALALAESLAAGAITPDEARQRYQTIISRPRADREPHLSELFVDDPRRAAYGAAHGVGVWVSFRTTGRFRYQIDEDRYKEEMAKLADVIRCIIGNPFRPVAFAPTWRTSSAVALAETIYGERAFDRLPILADALEEAGCDRPEVLRHCRDDVVHARGCWVVDGVLGKS